MVDTWLDRKSGRCFVRAERVLTSLAVVALLGGCLEARETAQPTANPLAFKSVWTNHSSDSSYLAVEIEVSETVMYELVFNWNATWDQSQALVLHDTFIQKTNGTAIYIGGQSVEGRTSCQMFPDAREANGCSPRDLVMSKKSTMGSSLVRGRYLLLARAFGATSGEISVEFSASHPVRAIEVQEGRTSLVLLDEQIREGNHSFGASGQWQAGESFLGTFRVAGPRMEGPAWTGEGVGGNHSFVPAAPGYRNEQGNITLEPSFPGTEGEWRLEATGGLHAEKGPAYAAFGVLYSPFFVSPSGEMRQYGPYE
jgi:hypothetical protein